MVWSDMLRSQERAARASRARQEERAEARRSSDLTYDHDRAEVGPPVDPLELIAEADAVLVREQRAAIWKGPAVAYGAGMAIGSGAPDPLGFLIVLTGLSSVVAWSWAIPTGMGVLRQRGQLLEDGAEGSPVQRVMAAGFAAVAGGVAGWGLIVLLIVWVALAG